MQVTVFKDTFSKQAHSIEDLSFAQKILSGHWKDWIGQLQKMDEKGYNQAKTTLPCVTWSGTFSERKAAGLLMYSRLVVLDIDNLEQEQVNNTMQALSQDEYVRYAFRSPSGKGIKIVVQVSSGPEHHLAAFLHLQKIFQEKYLLKIDDSGKDICRLCYASYDPRMVIREKYTVFEVDTRFGEVKTLAQNVTFKNYDSMRDPEKILDLCRMWIEDAGIHYVEGNRNRYVHAVACAMNRCGVNQDTARDLLINACNDLDDKEVRGCVKSAYFQNQGEHATYEVKDLQQRGGGKFVAPPYVANYTEDVVENDLMRITAMLHHHGLSMRDTGDIVAKVAKFYKGQGMIDLDRSSLAKLMNTALETLKQKVADHSEQFALKYEMAEDIGKRLIEQDLMSGIVHTYIGEVDKDMNGGLRPKSFYGAIGLGGTWKSILIQYMCYANAANGVPSLYCNGEMSDFQWWERLASMVLGIDLQAEMMLGKITKENISGVVETMKEALGGNIFVFTGSNFNYDNIMATVDHIYAKHGKKIRLIGIDGITQMDSQGREEIPAAIANTGVCKEIAKNANGGEGSIVVALMHLSGEQNFLFRDTGLKARGGLKTTANMDGYFGTSLLLDPETNHLENDDDILFLQNKFYLFIKDKRSRTGVIRKIINVDPKTLHLNTEVCDPNDYEIKINKKQRQQ